MTEPFPWAERSLAVRVALTLITLPIAVPVLMVLAYLMLAVAAILILTLPVAYVFAGIASPEDSPK